MRGAGLALDVTLHYCYPVLLQEGGGDGGLQGVQ